MIAIYHKGLYWIFTNIEAYENRHIKAQRSIKDPVIKVVVDISDVLEEKKMSCYFLFF